MTHRSQDSGLARLLLAAGVLLAATATADAKPPTASSAPPAGPQTVTFTNATTTVLPCTMGSSAFTLQGSSVEIRQIPGPITVTCAGQSFHVKRPVQHHAVRCARVKGGSVSCAEIDPPATPPPSSVVIENATVSSINCTFDGGVNVGAAPQNVSARTPASGTGNCGSAGSVELSPSVIVHTVRCVQSKKYGPQCVEIPVEDVSTPAPPPPPAAPTKESPRVVSTSPVAINCRASLSSSRAFSGWISVPAGGEGIFPLADVKDDILTVECSPPEWKKFGTTVVTVPAPHAIPTTIECKKGSEAGAITCAAK